jgi:hypothetical protein
MTTILRHAGIVATGIVLTGAVTTAGIAVAAGQNQTINGCVGRLTGILRVIDPAGVRNAFRPSHRSRGTPSTRRDPRVPPAL